ncbi:hypothetical protein ACEWY4_023747 [Coilia grayii]|uniref:Uncharacterized protein n=1 Tax=Coilia grayii TaxID=363190 RepID=A0ABD1IYC7_9TELE
MQSLDSSNKWSSRESLSSTPSFLYSESDQTEDEGDVFSEGEGGQAPLDRFSLAAVAAASPTRRLSAGYHRDQQAYRPQGQLGGPVHHGQPPSPPTPPRSEGDLAFAQKCAELQGYLRPLLELLNGLKTGRFDKGLSTFQQSVAMDRLQRIVGVLQKPHLGEKYLRTLQQIEMMLKTWFPQVCTQHSSPPVRQNATSILSGHWRRDQLHIPVKKRRRSRSYSDSCSAIPPASKRAQSHQRAQGIGSPEDTPLREESVTSKHNADLSPPPSDVSCHTGKRRGGGGVGGGLPPLVIPPSCVGSHTEQLRLIHHPHISHTTHHPC